MARKRKKQLFGAAATARAKRLSKLRRKRRRNPARVSTPAYRAGWEKTFGKKTAAKKKGTKPKKKGGAKKIVARTQKVAAPKAVRKAAKPKKQKTAAPKAAKKTTKRKGSTMAKKKSKKARSAAAKKGWRRRRAAKRYAQTRMRQGAKRHYRRTKKGRRMTKAGGRGVRSLVRARRTIKYQKRYGSGRAKHYMSRYKMRSNPSFKDVLNTMKQAVPVVASLYATRLLLNQPFVQKIPGIDKLGKHATPLLAVGAVALAHFATRTKFLSKWRGGILLGTGLNAVDTLIRAYAPANVQSMMGLQPLSDYIQLGDVYDEALGDYVNLSAEEDLGDYVQMGDDGLESEMGMLESEMGDTGTASQLQIGTGIGQRAGAGMLRPVPARSMVKAVPERGFVKEVPDVTEAYDDARVLYKGIFSGGYN